MLAPIIAEGLRRFLAVPEVVILIALGIVMGPDVLGLVHQSTIVSALSDFGLTFLMFLAGTELDLTTMRKGHMPRAAGSWGVSVVLALAVGAVLHGTGLVLDTVVVALCLTTTAVGTLLPILRDAGVLRTAVGPAMLSVGSIGEFGPIVAVAVLLTDRDVKLSILLLTIFVAVAVVAALLAMQVHPPRVIALMRRHLHSTSQLPVRISVLLVVLLVYLALKLSLDVLLGAFAAGVVVRLFITEEDSPTVTSKLEAIGFGFLIPIFFIESGVTFDLTALTHRPKVLLLVPLFTALFLFTRSLPTWAFFRGVLTRVQARSAGRAVGNRSADHRRDHVTGCPGAPHEAPERRRARGRRHAERPHLPAHRDQVARGFEASRRRNRPRPAAGPSVVAAGEEARYGTCRWHDEEGRTCVSMSSSTTGAAAGSPRRSWSSSGSCSRSKSWHGSRASSSTTSRWRSVSKTANPQFSLIVTTRGLCGGAPPGDPSRTRPSLRRKRRGRRPPSAVLRRRRRARPASRRPGAGTRQAGG